MILNFTDYIDLGMELPTVMQNIGLALLTIFIPVALFLFEKNDDSGFEVLDRAVILDYLVKARELLWKLSLIFIPLLFWDIRLPFIRFFIFILWIIGVALVVETLIRSYKWIRNGRFQYRIDYLNTLRKGDDELEDLWRSVWKATSINSQNEAKLFEVFSSLVDSLFENEINTAELDFLVKLLNDFQIFIQKRSFIFLTSPIDVFSKVLHWHFISWQREHTYMAQAGKLDLFVKYMGISRVLDSIVSSITERVIKDGFSYGYFELMDKHIKAHEDDFVSNKERDFYYAESLLAVFYSKFFIHIEEAHDRFDIWNHYFPKNWFVTKENILDPKNIVSKVTKNYFFNWIRDRIKLPQNSKIDLDMTLDNISKEIFPHVDPFFWGAMLTFLFRPWSDDGRMKSLIEYPRNFGHVGRIYTSWDNGGNEDKAMLKITENRERDMRNSIELLLTIFPKEFTIEKISKHISELESLKYETNTKEYLRKNEMISYFNNVLKFHEDSKVK